MDSSNFNIPACIENNSVHDGIMSATFDCETQLPVSHANVEMSDYLVSSDLINLSLCQEVSPTSVSCSNNPENKLDNEKWGLIGDLNQTFDARKKKSDTNEVRGVILDKTLNLFSTKPGNLSLQVDSEESLGIISDVLDDNTTLDLLVPFKAKEPSNVQFIKKSGDANLLSFSPLHLRNSNGMYFAGNGSPMICRFTSTPEPPSLKPQVKNSEVKQDFPTDEKVDELDFIDPEKCYEDFKKGNIFASTSKVSLLKTCLNKLETIPFVPNDLPLESQVQLEKNNTVEINSAEQSSFHLNATFDIKPEPLKEILPVSDLQTNIVHVSIEDIPKNDTYTFDSMIDTAEKGNKVNTTKDLPEVKESNPSNLTEVFSSSFSISDMDKSKLSKHDSYIVKSPKSNVEAKKPMFKRSIAVPTQKLYPSKIENSLKSKFNSTFCMENYEPNPTKLDKRCSLGNSLGIPGSSKIGSLKTQSQLKSNLVSNSKYNGNKLSEVKTLTSTRSAISLRKNAESPIKQKNLINNSLSRTTVKPKVDQHIKKPSSEGIVSLNNTFTKESISFALSPILENDHQLTESLEDIPDSPHVEKNTISKTDEDKKIPKYSGNTNTCVPIKNESENISLSNKCVKKPTVIKRIQKVDSTNIPFPLKPKQTFCKLVSSKKTNDGIITGSENINVNGKCNLSQTIKVQQFSRLPIFGSTYSKKLMPNKPKVNKMMPIDSLKVLPNQCSSANNSKPSVQPARGLRAPGIFISKEKKS